MNFFFVFFSLLFYRLLFSFFSSGFEGSRNSFQRLFSLEIFFLFNSGLEETLSTEDFKSRRGREMEEIEK